MGAMKVNLPKHILELLLQEEEAVVPGLGTFSFINRPASFGDGRKTLLPPGKKIAYSESHDESSTALSSIIAKNTGLSTEFSKNFVEEFSSEVLRGLMESNRVEIAYLGNLQKEEDGKINFISNQLTEDRINKSLPKVDLPPAQAVPPPVYKEENPIETKPVSQVGTKVEAVPMLQNTRTGEVFKSSSLWNWLIAIFGFLGLLALLIFGFKACNSDTDPVITEAEKENLEYLEEQEALKSNDSGEGSEEISYDQEVEVLEDEQEMLEETVADNDTDNNDGENETVTSIDSNLEADDCIIILGSFTNSENVEAISRKVRNSSHSIYTESHGPYTRVGLKAPCADISNDYKGFLRKVRAEFDINGAWYLNPELKDI